MNDAITTLTTLDYVGIIGSVAAGIIAIKSLFAAFEWVGKKLGIKFKWIEDKKKDHALLKKTVENVDKLEKQLVGDEQKYSSEDKAIGEVIKELQKDLEKISGVSEEILIKIKNIDNMNELQKQAIMEVLHDTIDKQCDYYINQLHGIPTSEVQWFSDRFALYEKLGGNHGLCHKVNYCRNKLPILPD